MATLARPFNEISRRVSKSVSTAKIVLNQKQGEALYFSRLAIPHSRQGASEKGVSGLTSFKHIGLYGYRRSFLQKVLCSKNLSPLEN